MRLSVLLILYCSQVHRIVFNIKQVFKIRSFLIELLDFARIFWIKLACSGNTFPENFCFRLWVIDESEDVFLRGGGWGTNIKLLDNIRGFAHIPL